MLLSSMVAWHINTRYTEAEGPFKSFLVKRVELPKARVGYWGE